MNAHNNTNDWIHYINEAHKCMIEENDTRELGKIRAAAAEFLVKDWINNNTNLKVFRRKELKELNSDKNESGYDLFCPENNLRIQVKYRADTFHLETTRRNSRKNINQNQTGHIAYSANECDMFVFVRPSDNFSDIKFIAIPVDELKDKKNSNILVTRVSSSVIKKFENISIQTLNSWESK